MKTLLTSIIACLISSTGLFAQTIDKLDEKNGFKDFTLGDNYSKWEGQLLFDRSYDDGSKSYIYTGTCCNKVFNYPVDKIILNFYNNKLTAVYITTEKFQKGYKVSQEYTKWRPDDFESIKTSFTYLFGEPTSVDSPESGDITYFWLGEKVYLISRYEYLGVQDGDRQLISIGDISFINSKIESGF